MKLESQSGETELPKPSKSKANKKRNIKPKEPNGKDVSMPGEPESCLTSFYKREIFKHLNKHGCSEESLEKVLSRFTASKSKIEEYINGLSNQAETYLHQECSSLCFDNIEAWLRVMKSYNFTVPTEAYAEYLEEIAENEPIPMSKDLNGIDMRSIYLFLSNAMLGLPQPALNDETAKFLSKEMEALIEEVNNETGDEIAYVMYEKLRQFPTENQIFDVLDPFGLNL